MTSVKQLRFKNKQIELINKRQTDRRTYAQTYILIGTFNIGITYKNGIITIIQCKTNIIKILKTVKSTSVKMQIGFM